MKANALSKSYTLAQLVERCVGKRDRECIYRLAKGVAIIEQDFEAALQLMDLQNQNKPRRPEKKGGRR